MPIRLSIVVYERGDNGVPTTNYVASLHGRVQHYTHSITDRVGFESMSISFPARLDEAQDWLSNGPMRSVVVTGPDATTCWEGFIETVHVQAGQKAATMSLTPVANRVRCKYTTVLGTPGTTATASNTTSQALYGTKDGLTTLDLDTAAQAAQKRDRVLTESALPRSSDPTEARTGDLGGVSVELRCAGWYTTLGWVMTSRSSTSTTSSTSQVATLIGTASPGIGAINPFLSTDVSDIVSGGPAATEYIEPETTYQAKIEALLGAGNGSGTPYTWGVYEGRVFRVALSAAATPTTISYIEDVGMGVVLDAGGLVVAPWDVRPNAMAVVRNLLDPAPVAGAIDASARKYVGRVTCTVDEQSVGVTLEPSETSDITTILAAYRKISGL